MIPSSASTAARYASAALLITASSGFGAFYAWTSGSYHGPLLGTLSVLMALGLECAKPFAIEGALSAVKGSMSIHSLARALSLALLGIVAITYSLTAEFSLIASQRAASVAQRHHAATTTATIKARYDALAPT
jgi:hypothetical protein